MQKASLNSARSPSILMFFGARVARPRTPGASWAEAGPEKSNSSATNQGDVRRRKERALFMEPFSNRSNAKETGFPPRQLPACLGAGGLPYSPPLKNYEHGSPSRRDHRRRRTDRLLAPFPDRFGRDVWPEPAGHFAPD